MFQMELDCPMECQLSTLTEEAVRIWQRLTVHCTIAVEFDIPDKGMGVLHVDARPMNDGCNLNRQRAGALLSPEALGARHALCRATQHGDERGAFLSRQCGIDAIGEDGHERVALSPRRPAFWN